MIPFLDLKAQYKSIKPEIDKAVIDVIESGSFVLGPYVSAFEKEFAAYCANSDAVGVNSGTSALHLALLAAGRDEAAGCRAILQLVGTVHHVDQHHSGRGAEFFRITRPGQRGLPGGWQLGRRAVRGL